MDIATYQRSTGDTAEKPSFGPMADPENVCTSRLGDKLKIGRARVVLGARFLGARSSNGDVQITLAGQPVNDTGVMLPAGQPASILAPKFVQLVTDTCVRGGFVASLPVYSGCCIVPPRGVSSVVVWYECAAKAFPLDLSRYVNQGGLWGQGTFPVGYQMIDGVPFLRPGGREREWAASAAVHGSARPAILSIPLARKSVSSAYFLLIRFGALPDLQPISPSNLRATTALISKSGSSAVSISAITIRACTRTVSTGRSLDPAWITATASAWI